MAKAEETVLSDRADRLLHSDAALDIGFPMSRDKSTDSKDDDSNDNDVSAQSDDQNDSNNDNSSHDNEDDSSSDDGIDDASDDSGSSEDDSADDSEDDATADSGDDAGDDLSNDDTDNNSGSSEKYKFVVKNGVVVSTSEVKAGKEEADDFGGDETYSVSDGLIIKTEVKKYGTQSTTYADLDGDGVYAVVQHVWTKNAATTSDDNDEFEDWYEQDGDYEDYEIVVNGNSIQLFDKETAELTSSFDTADRIILNDKGFATALDENACKAYRIYQAAFDRDPMSGDTSGLGYWISKIDSGMDVEEVAARFFDSPEFRGVYGSNADNATFLTKLYENILDRTPDAAGYEWWLKELNTNPDRDWAKVLAEFSESKENQESVATIIAEGIVFDIVT